MTATGDAATMVEAVLGDASVVVCCGSGGVGKTTVAAALGVEAARRGRRVVVLTIDPAKRLADALGVDELGPEPSEIELDGSEVIVGGELWAMMLDTAAAFTAVVRRYATTREQAERIVANRFFRNMAGSLSGTQEYMAAETLHLLARDERFDLVVVDTPPTRSALDFLAAPGVLARFLDHRLFRLLMLPARPGMRMFNAATQPVLRAIGRVVGSEVLADAVAFFQAFAGMEAGFRQRADDVIALLRVPTTVFLLVGSPRREAVGEAAWFAGQLAAQGIDHVAGVANRVHPRFGTGSAAAAREAAAGSAGEQRALWHNLGELRARRESELATLGEFYALFSDGACVEVPQLASDVHDREGLAHVGRHLFGGLRQEPLPPAPPAR
jgi:anion-transporting  ArsA/GET3 family ATPase